MRSVSGCDNRLRSTGRLSSEFHTVIITVYAWQLAAPQNAYCIRLMKLRSTVRIWAVSGAWTSISLLPCSRCWFMNGFHDRPVTCLCSSSSCTILTSPPCRKPTIKSFLFLGRDHFALHIVQILHLLRPGYEWGRTCNVNNKIPFSNWVPVNHFVHKLKSWYKSINPIIT